jgi:hypothetical protein
MFDLDSDLTFFWILWFLTLAATMYSVVRGYVHGRTVFGLPLIAGLMFGYFYVFQTFFVANDLSHLLRPWILELGQAVALICFLALLSGWYFGMKRSGPL